MRLPRPAGQARARSSENGSLFPSAFSLSPACAATARDGTCWAGGSWEAERAPKSASSATTTATAVGGRPLLARECPFCFAPPLIKRLVGPRRAIMLAARPPPTRAWGDDSADRGRDATRCAARKKINVNIGFERPQRYKQTRGARQCCRPVAPPRSRHFRGAKVRRRLERRAGGRGSRALASRQSAVGMAAASLTRATPVECNKSKSESNWPDPFRAAAGDWRLASGELEKGTATGRLMLPSGAAHARAPAPQRAE